MESRQSTGLRRCSLSPASRLLRTSFCPVSSHSDALIGVGWRELIGSRLLQAQPPQQAYGKRGRTFGKARRADAPRDHEGRFLAFFRAGGIRLETDRRRECSPRPASCFGYFFTRRRAIHSRILFNMKLLFTFIICGIAAICVGSAQTVRETMTTTTPVQAMGTVTTFDLAGNAIVVTGPDKRGPGDLRIHREDCHDR